MKDMHDARVPIEEHRYTLLLVDDDPAVLATTHALLSDAHDVTVASSGEEAVAILATQPFDLVCSDFGLGGALTGVDVLARAAKLSPYVGRILVTGKPLRDGGGAGSYVLSKPCDPARLLALVERAGVQAFARKKALAARGELRRGTDDAFRAAAPAIEEPPAGWRSEPHGPKRHR